MRNQEKNRRRRTNRKEEFINYYNHEHYADPTPFFAINNVVAEKRR